MNKQTRKSMGLVLIVISLIWVIAVTLWLATYWPVYYAPGTRVILKQGIILWTEPYADWIEPDWFFFPWIWVIPIILTLAGVLLRGDILSSKNVAFGMKFLGELLYFVVGIFASGLILLAFLPQIHWWLQARIRFIAYGVILLGVVFYFKEIYLPKQKIKFNLARKLKLIFFKSNSSK